MWHCVTHCAGTPLVLIQDETAIHIMYCPVSCMKLNASRQCGWLTVRNKIFLCVICWLQSFILSLLFCTKTNPCLFCSVCASLCVCVCVCLKTSGCGAFCFGNLKNTAYINFLHWSNQWFNQCEFFAKSLYFAKLWCFNCKCLTMSKKIKIWSKSEQATQLFLERWDDLCNHNFYNNLENNFTENIVCCCLLFNWVL